MHPDMSVNYLAVVVYVIAAMPMGYLWFGPLFGKVWLRHVEFEGIEVSGGGAMVKSMLSAP